MLQGFFTPDLDPSRDYNERDRKRRLAEALMMQGADYSPVRSWTQGASRLAQALVGGYESGKYDKEQAAADAPLKARMKEFQDYLDKQGLPPSASPYTSNTASAPAGGARPVAGGGVGNFDTSMARTFQFEGGLNRRDTNGTPSNFGINQKANPDVDVMALTQESAKPLYKARYWDTIGADNLPPALAHVAFDTSVIAGPNKAKELLAASGGDPAKFMELRSQFLNSLIQRDPAKYGPYARAWANRDAQLRADISGGAPGQQPMPTQMAYAPQATASDAPQPALRQATAAVAPAPAQRPPVALPEGALSSGRTETNGLDYTLGFNPARGVDQGAFGQGGLTYSFDVDRMRGQPESVGAIPMPPARQSAPEAVGAVMPQNPPMPPQRPGAALTQAVATPQPTAPTPPAPDPTRALLAAAIAPGASPQLRQTAMQLYQLGQREEGATPVDLGDRIALMNKRGQVTGYLPKTRAPVTVGEGQRLVDPVTGREIMGADGEKSPTVQRIKQPDGSEVAVQWDKQRREWVPLKAPEGGNAVASPKLTEAQSKDVGFYNRGEKLIPRLEKQDTALTEFFSRNAGNLPIVGNYLKSPEYRQAEQTARELLAVILRKDTGAAVTDKEFENYGVMYLPQPGDDPGTVKQKQEGRRTAIEGIRMGLGTADVLFKQREALDAAKGGNAPSSPDAPRKVRRYNPETGKIE